MLWYSAAQIWGKNVGLWAKLNSQLHYIELSGVTIDLNLQKKEQSKM